MAMNTVRRIASELLGVGESKVRFSTGALDKISEALTRDDIRARVEEGSIYAIPRRGVSRARGAKKRAQMRKGRRFGTGSRKGKFAARSGAKDSWMSKVRAQRNYLEALLRENKLAGGNRRRIYLMIKGNAFKGVKVMQTYLRDNKLLK